MGLACPVIAQSTPDEVNEENIKALFRKHGFHVTKDNMPHLVSAMNVKTRQLLSVSATQKYPLDRFKSVEANCCSFMDITELEDYTKYIVSHMNRSRLYVEPIFSFHKLIGPNDRCEFTDRLSIRFPGMFRDHTYKLWSYAWTV